MATNISTSSMAAASPTTTTNTTNTTNTTTNNNTANHNRNSTSRAPPSSTAAAATAAGSKTQQQPISSSVTTPTTTPSVLPPLHVRYPVNAVVQVTLAPTGEQVQGTVYTTDEISQSLVLQKSLVHTTLAHEIRILHVPSIVSCQIVTPNPSSAATSTTATATPLVTADSATTTTTTTTINNNSDAVAVVANHHSTHHPKVALDTLSSPLPTISRKTLEEREKRAMRLAEESLRHINQKASPEGQVTFDRLLKACNEVVWSSGESILVLGQIQVDPPYGPEQCQLLPEAESHAGSQESLERVRKIVASVTTNATTTMSRSNSSSSP